MKIEAGVRKDVVLKELEHYIEMHLQGKPLFLESTTLSVSWDDKASTKHRNIKRIGPEKKAEDSKIERLIDIQKTDLLLNRDEKKRLMAELEKETRYLQESMLPKLKQEEAITRMEYIIKSIRQTTKDIEILEELIQNLKTGHFYSCRFTGQCMPELEDFTVVITYIKGKIYHVSDINPMYTKYYGIYNGAWGFPDCITEKRQLEILQLLD